MKSTTLKVVETIRGTLFRLCEHMSPADYKEVLEEVAADIEASLDALRAENPVLESE